MPPTNPDRILALVCAQWDVTLDGLRGTARTPRLSEARAAAAVLLRDYARLGDVLAARALWKDQKSVRVARGRAAELCKRDALFAARLDGARAALRGEG